MRTRVVTWSVLSDQGSQIAMALCERHEETEARVRVLLQVLHGQHRGWCDVCDPEDAQ